MYNDAVVIKTEAVDVQRMHNARQRIGTTSKNDAERCKTTPLNTKVSNLIAQRQWNKPKRYWQMIVKMKNR